MAESMRPGAAGERRAARVRAVFALRNLSLHQVSAASARIYGARSASHIPHTLYHALSASVEFGPSLAQTCALSRITGFRIEDWLAVFGIDLVRIAGIETALPLKRTRLLNPVCDQDGSFPACTLLELERTRSPEKVIPLGQLARWWSEADREEPDPAYLFAKIGSEDAFAWPELLPGSIVRLLPEPEQGIIAPDRGDPPLRMIRHESGLWCGRFHVSGDGTIQVAARELAYAQIALRIPHEARIIGVVDMEIRWLQRFERPEVPREFSGYRVPERLDRSPAGLGSMVRRARERAGLTLETASQLSREVAKYLGRAQYAIAQSTLSEYESQDDPPRHLEKVVTLCLVYGIRLHDFVAAAGIALDQLGRDVMPSHLLPGAPRPEVLSALQKPSQRKSGTSCSLRDETGDVPWFPGDSLARLSMLPRLSLRDFCWLPEAQPFMPAHTGGTFLALVDRRRKRPVRLPRLPPWQQPAWVLVLRNGEHRCACCSFENGNLVLYPNSDRTRSPEVLVPGRDAEVVGQILAVARRIGTQSRPHA